MPLNDYELLDEIQRTAMSTVYRFRDGEGRIVAVKRPPSAPVRVLRRRFKREIETMRKFAGPNTMPVLEFDPSFEWYVMPLASRTLQQLTVPQPAPLALEVLEALSVALTPLHASGRVHRDLKPENILWLDEPQPGRWVVADFGIVRDAPGETTATLTQGFVGSVNWAAPEQRWAHHVTPAADVFAAGLILSWIVTGTPGSPDLGQLSEYPALAAVLRKATSDRPSRRQQTVAELLEAVSRATESAVSATTIHELVRAGDVAALSAHMLARRSDHTETVRVLPELRRTQVQDWFSNDPDGANAAMTQVCDDLSKNMGPLQFTEIDKFLTWGIEVLRVLLAQRRYADAEDFGIDLFSLIADINQYQPADDVLDWIGSLAPRDQPAVEAALHGSTALQMMQSRAANRWERRGDSELLRKLRVSGQ